MKEMIKVLIVEDSKVASEYLQFILGADPSIQVIGIVGNGKLALEFLENNRPDVITMDIDMPVMNGLEATRHIMAIYPTPIIIVSASRNTSNTRIAMEALAAGALSVISKPKGMGHPDENEEIKKLITMVKLMSEIKVLTRRHPPKPIVTERSVTKTTWPDIASLTKKKLIVIGVSSGGPPVLKQIFSGITSNFPIPILVVYTVSRVWHFTELGWTTLGRQALDYLPLTEILRQPGGI